MKKIIGFTLLFSAVLLMVSCNSKKQQELREQHIKDSFNNLINEQKSEIETLFAQMKDIDDNLNDIQAQYTELQVMTKNTSEVDENTAKSIGNKINAMVNLIAQDKEKIAALQSNLSKQKNSFAENKRLQEQLLLLNSRLNERETEIANLTSQLKDKNIKIDNLNGEVAKLQAQQKKNANELSKLEDEQYTGYFIVGTKKELKKAGVIDDKGGLLGIGKTQTLSNNTTMDAMQRVDIRNVNEIPLVGKKTKLVTPHPSGSYTFVGGANKATSIHIDSPSSFWKHSKVLVIMVK